MQKYNFPAHTSLSGSLIVVWLWVFNSGNGVYEGSVKEWTEDGTPYLSKNYSNGKEDGIQKMWYLDGTLRANYEVRNNRRYGWIGGLTCSSTIKEALDKKE